MIQVVEKQKQRQQKSFFLFFVEISYNFYHLALLIYFIYFVISVNSTALKTATNGMIASVVWSKPSNMVQEPTMPVKLMLASHWETNALNCTLRKITNQFLNFYLFIIGLLCGEFHLLYNTQVRKKVPFFKIRCVLKIAILLQLSNASYHNYYLFIVFIRL